METTIWMPLLFLAGNLVALIFFVGFHLVAAGRA